MQFPGRRPPDLTAVSMPTVAMRRSRAIRTSFRILRAIIAGGASATYTATSLDYSGSDTTPTNAFLALDSNGSAASDSDAIETSVFDMTGLVAISAPGTYNFSVNDSDDASYLFIDGQEVASLPGSHGVQNASGTATFSAAGNYPIEVMYVNQEYNGGMGGARFQYASDFSVIGSPHTELMHLVAVPEPASLALMSFGVLGGFFVIRRRK